ncbi:nucleolin 1 [Eutrema salsugineum]|uniref:nucleolin 1 n=1 Tax=Eutrema salsugineum TaxID=72664 RepID=UPI000CED18A0|nr:nucleolin 1 [Eutrema salsugineum]
MESATTVEAVPAVIEATTKPLNKVSSDDLETKVNLESQNKESEEMPKEPQPPKPTTTGGSRTLFVSNLPFQVEKSDIEFFFKEAGEVVDVRLAMPEDDGIFRGFGFVDFASSEEAERALEFHGRPLLGREIILQLHLPEV